jgi:hypothetical protein
MVAGLQIVSCACCWQSFANSEISKQVVERSVLEHEDDHVLEE